MAVCLLGVEVPGGSDAVRGHDRAGDRELGSQERVDDCLFAAERPEEVLHRG